MISKHPPEGFPKKSDGVAVIFMECRGKILLLLRHPNKTHGNKWCLPGGKPKDRETWYETVLREVGEEIGVILDGDSLTYLDHYFVRYRHADIVLHVYRTLLPDEPAVRLKDAENTAYVWVTPTMAMDYSLIPGLKECIEWNYVLRPVHA